MTPLLLDEMLGGRLAEALRRHGMDVRALVETADQRGLNSFPQDGSLTGALVGAVLMVQRNDLVPRPDAVGFLTPDR